jgi:cysteinyl-tRNA synthetase
VAGDDDLVPVSVQLGNVVPPEDPEDWTRPLTWAAAAGMLRHDGEKMSKSLGNLVLVRDLLGSYTGDAIRHYLVSHHYRDELIFDEAALEQSAQMVARLRQACLVAEEIEPLAGASADPSAQDPMVAEHRARFLAAMDDDLDTPAALPELHALAALCQQSEDRELIVQAGWMVRELGARILGLRLAPAPSLAEAPAAGVA